MKLKYIILLFIGILFHHVHSQTISIKGNAIWFANKEISVSIINDYITESSTLIKNVPIDNGGQFNFKLESNVAREYVLTFSKYGKHTVILEPNKSYELEIPDSLGEELYFPSNMDSLTLMYQISNLSYDINYFSIYNYEDLLTGRAKKKVKNLADSLNLKYAFMKSEFFQISKEYQLADLMMNARYKGYQTLFEMFFKDKPVYFSHPDYMRFFNTFYKGMFTGWLKQNSNVSLRAAIQSGTPIDTVLFYVKKEPWAGENEKLAELITLRGFVDLYYTPGTDKFKLETLTSELLEKSKNEEIKQICINFLNIIRKLKPGNKYIPFTGKNTMGEVVSTDELLNKNLYILFADLNTAESINQVNAIKNIYNEYKKDCNFLVVCSSSNYTAVQNIIDQNKAKWNFMIVDPKVETDYEIMTYPSGMLISKEEIIIANPAKLPSEGVAFTIYDLIKKQKGK